MIVLGVVPSKVPSEISAGLVIIQERAGILWGSFYGAKSRFDKRIVIGGSGASKQLRHAVIFTEPADRFGFHLAATVVDEFGPLVLREIQDMLFNQTSLQQEARLLGRLLPADAPLDGFSGPLIQQ